MGFSQAAAFTIIAGAALLYGGIMVGSTFNAQTEWSDAWLETEGRVAAMRHAHMTLESGVYDDSPPPGSEALILTLTNSGSVTLDVDRLTYLVESVYHGSDKVRSAEVDGVAAGVWPPGSTLVVDLDVSVDFPRGGGGADPDFAVVTDQYGTQAFWRA